MLLFDKSVDQEGVEINTPKNYDIELQPVYFDADVDVEGTVSGTVSKPNIRWREKSCAIEKDTGIRTTWPQRFSTEQYGIKTFGHPSGNHWRPD